MHDHEVGFTQGWIVESPFQQQRIAARLAIKTTRAFETVDVHREAKPARLLRNVKEEKVLECLIVAGGRFAPAEEAVIRCSSSGAIGIVKIKFSQVRGFILDGYGSVSLL